MRRIGLFLGGVVLACVVAATGFAGDTIKVGIVDTYTGPVTTYTNDVRDGFQMAVDKINAKGGVLGKKIEVLLRDDTFKSDVGLTLAKELILQENVDILMGTINSATALAISDLAKKEKVPFLVTFSKSGKITGEKGHRYVFGMNENTDMIGRATATVLAKKPYARYWIAGDDYEYGHAIAESIFGNLKKLNPKVTLLGETWWKMRESDFTPYITQILAAKPDFVIVATGGGSMVNFQKAAQSTGFNKRVPFYQHTGIELSTLMPQGQNAPEGVFGTANYLFYYPDTKENKSFAEEFQKRFHRHPKSGAVYGYMAAQFLEKAYAKAGKIDKEKFIDALEGMTADSPIGTLEVRACDHQIVLPMYFGVTRKSPRYEFLVAGDILSVSGKDYMPSCEEIMKERAK
ncbi:MAG: amino acid ABC transporter substrate-binding protein [Deltaproteobacteria bacterium GWC2_65_14]|nr:MAG: amino acid ABC transporter substrate-binding protein [Deltaproteobacteria bacterium GWC2_65_14]